MKFVWMVCVRSLLGIVFFQAFFAVPFFVLRVDLPMHWKSIIFFILFVVSSTLYVLLKFLLHALHLRSEDYRERYTKSSRAERARMVAEGMKRVS